LILAIYLVVIVSVMVKPFQINLLIKLHVVGRSFKKLQYKNVKITEI